MFKTRVWRSLLDVKLYTFFAHCLKFTYHLLLSKYKNTCHFLLSKQKMNIHIYFIHSFWSIYIYSSHMTDQESMYSTQSLKIHQYFKIISNIFTYICWKCGSLIISLQYVFGHVDISPPPTNYIAFCIITNYLSPLCNG